MPDSPDIPLKNKIFLYGPSGSGKSTVGKALAGSLALPFWDLDVEIETRSGISIPGIFKQEGEAGFRERERQTLQGILDSGEAVIALGGGALTHLPTRSLAESHGQVVRLTAETEILVSRLQADSTHRPLLSGSPEGGKPSLETNLGQLLTRRASHYAEFTHQVDTGGLSPQAVAVQIQSCLGFFHLRGMASAKHPAYDVRVDPGGLAHLGVALQARGLKGPLGIVTDVNVGAHYLDAVLGSLRGSPAWQSHCPSCCKVSVHWNGASGRKTLHIRHRDTFCRFPGSLSDNHALP